jgi:hypothetical protein
MTHGDRSFSFCLSAWGVSAGTGTGQIMVKVLPPNRIGKIVLDGVINPAQYFDTKPYYDRCKPSSRSAYKRMTNGVRCILQTTWRTPSEISRCSLSPA